MLRATSGEADPVARARELVGALSRFCKSIEELTTLESEVGERRAGGDPSQALRGAQLADPKAQLLALTELVQQAHEVLGELFTEIEAARLPLRTDRSA